MEQRRLGANSGRGKVFLSAERKHEGNRTSFFFYLLNETQLISNFEPLNL